MEETQETYSGYLTQFERKFKARAVFGAVVSAFTIYGMAWDTLVEGSDDIIKPDAGESEQLFARLQQVDQLPTEPEIPTGKIGFIAGLAVGAEVARRIK